MKTSKFYWFWTLFFPVQWFLIQLLTNYPSVVENYYSNGIYKYTSHFVRFLFGWIPFSMGDLLYLFAIYIIIKSVIRMVKHRNVSIVKTIGILSIIYFAFHFLWGLNYLREPIDASFELDSTEYTTEELDRFTGKLVEKINSIHLQITHNDTVPVLIPYEKKEVYHKLKKGYENLEKTIPSIGYQYSSSKHSIISLPLSYMGFSGYLNPFTGEAQVNHQIPITSYPSTSCHEVAHQLGYAAENELNNFIGFLAATSHDDLYFQFSGYLLALRYALSNLHNHSQEMHRTQLIKVNKGIIKNIRQSQLHWAKFQNPFEPLFKMIFNQYLKVNKQKAGIKSYHLLVGLLINYEKKHVLF